MAFPPLASSVRSGFHSNILQHPHHVFNQLLSVPPLRRAKPTVSPCCKMISVQSLTRPNVTLLFQHYSFYFGRRTATHHPHTPSPPNAPSPQPPRPSPQPSATTPAQPPATPPAPHSSIPKIANNLIAASAITVPGPNTATTPDL
ncbi:MAG: hypothetical protein LBQ31_07850 [Bacteroidales bacterium]|nr:hypothetical protein [Bacteroidales bacterium]